MALAGTVITASLVGCPTLNADEASYWSDSLQADVEYDDALAAAREAGFTVEEPFYVNSREPRGIAPDGLDDLEARFGPGYRVFGFSLFHTDRVFIEVDVTGETAPVSLFDGATVAEEFPIESLPPEAWLVDRLTLAFDVSEADAREHAADLREQAAEGTDIPSVDVSAAVDFGAVYERVLGERTETTGSSTGGDGWYTETSFRDGGRLATVSFIVQSAEIRRTDGDRTYTLKLDRLGGLYARIGLPVGEEIPEDEYRDVFRELFDDVGIPSAVVDELTFEYAPSIW
ncbi:MAG: hypothetical protein ACOC06_02145 [Halorubrum sp.]